MAEEIRRVAGDGPPADAQLHGLFHLRWLTSVDRPISGPGAPRLCPDLVSACLWRQEQRKLAWNHPTGHVESPAAAVMDGSGPGTRLNCAWAETWTRRIHELAPRVDTPHDLLRLLASAEGLDHLPLSDDGVAGIGSLDDVWAIYVACQVDCGGDTCEWAAFARHAWKMFEEKRHIVRCHIGQGRDYYCLEELQST
ncbi:hypothetical protein OCS_02817 [Ophiocordyceps sinensis CO18]|uniref:Uncharacterized protein n=1 Tax=Ophiocordyceps sinensis (strain Co18 / CGMCC 3.14243) TaxID=911162 RepID=T5AFW1_OPHSC|nr:hypothetical protein OCS_02817 [Ophiocordyceps sinensis CO18]